MEELNLEDLKAEATSLGIAFSANIGAKKLSEKIEEFYTSQETSGKELQALVAANEAKEQEKSEVNSVETDKAMSIAKAVELKRKEAEQTEVVTIIDNDSRVNGQTTTCKVTCANMYFDLGSIILPLNIPVEVKKGHLDILRSAKLTHHVKDPKSGLTKITEINRYTISKENIDVNLSRA